MFIMMTTSWTSVPVFSVVAQRLSEYMADPADGLRVRRRCPSRSLIMMVAATVTAQKSELSTRLRLRPRSLEYSLCLEAPAKSRSTGTHGGQPEPLARVAASQGRSRDALPGDGAVIRSQHPTSTTMCHISAAPRRVRDFENNSSRVHL